jgi:hypothetical protein
MNKEELQKFKESIDRVYAACNTKAILLTSNEEIAKRLREEFPGIETKVIPNLSGDLMNTNTVYIIPAEERSIKFVYEENKNENQ